MRVKQRFPESRGFTLVELVVALAIGGLLVLTVHGVLSVAVDQSRRVTDAQRQLDRRENAARWLSEAIASLDIGQDNPGPFIGTPGEVEFACRLRTPNGWHEPARVSVRVVDHRLVADLLGGGVLVLADSVAGADLDYLVESGEASPWLRRWVSSVNPPLALRLRVRRLQGRAGLPEAVDTSLFLVGRRG